SEGTYKFFTLATDKAGNAESAPSLPDFQVQVLYDTTAPLTSDDAPGGWQNHDVTVTLSPTDSGPAGGVSGVDKTFYEVDGAGFVQGTSSVMHTSGLQSSFDLVSRHQHSTDKAG